MAQKRLLFIGSDGISTEHDPVADDVTFASYTVNGGGPVLSATGLDLNNTDLSDIQDLIFLDPTTGTLNQTAGLLIVNDILGKERSNALTTSADLLFPVITDVSGQVDAFRLPVLAGAPTATPTATGEGFLVWDSSDDALYAWTGSSWDNLNTVTSAKHIDDPTYLAAVGGITANDVVYISAGGTVGKARADAVATGRVIGLSLVTAAAAAAVTVRKLGVVSGFSGLTAGAPQYLSSATAGALTPTIPTGSGNEIILMGYAKSATELEIHMERLGRRS